MLASTAAVLPKEDVPTPTSNRACQSCARAKAKCTPQGDGSGGQCARCFRLKKDCVILPRSARKKRSPNANTNTAHLEEKIESLVTLLAAAQGNAVKPDGVSPSQNSDQTRSVHLTPVSNPTPPLWSVEVPTHNGGQTWKSQLPVNVPNATNQPALQRLGSSSFSSATKPAPYPSPGSEPLPTISNQDEDDLLRVYKEQFGPRFPFVIIPTYITASQLRADRPYLHRVIMALTSQSKRLQQIEMAKQFCMDVAEALILRGEKSLDMLQAMIIYNAWSYYYSPVIPHQQSSAMFQLTFSVLYDLGLTRPVRDVEGPEAIVDASKPTAEINTKEGRRTLEERRAFLSAYILTSAVSLYIKKSEGISFSSYMDYNCKILEQNAEYESDLLLVAIVRLQFVSEQFNKNVLTKTRDSDDLKAPSWMYIRAMQSELHGLWTSISPALRQNPLLIMTYHSIEIFLYEPSLQQNPIALGFTFGSSHRIDMLHACLESAKSLIELFLAYPLSVYFGLPVTELSHIGQAFARLFKLSMLDVPGWEVTYVRKMLVDADYFNRLISNFEQVGAVIDQSQPAPCRNSFPTGCAGAMRRVKALYDAKIGAEPTQTSEQEPPSSTVLEGVLHVDQMDWMDDVYWQELLNDTNFLGTTTNLS